jgi:hypothetical protein
MPDWTDNELTITGPKAERERFKNYAHRTENGKTKVLHENAFIPYPKKFSDQDLLVLNTHEDYDDRKKKAGVGDYESLSNVEKLVHQDWKKWHKANPYPQIKDGYNSGGYDWCISHWGTKWGFCESELHEHKGHIGYTFDTAWSPPEPLIQKMSQMFPKLKFELHYECEGGDGTGTIIWEAGKELSREEEE